MNHIQKKSILALVIVFAFQSYSLFGIMTRGNKDFVSNIVGATIFWLVYTVVVLLKKWQINSYVQAVAALAIISDGFFGYYLNLYTTSSPFDRIQHIFATYALALLFYAVITRLFNHTIQPKWMRFILLVMIGIGIGAVYEIFEYLSDTFMKPQIPNQPSLEDTDLDLISDFIGGLIAGIHTLFVDFGPKGPAGERRARR